MDRILHYDTKRQGWFRRRIILAGAIAVIGIISIGFTDWFIDRSSFLSSLRPHRERVFAVELSLFGIAAVEVLSHALRERYASYYTRPDVIQRDMIVRAALRTVTYGALGVAIVSLLAQNATLAVSIGSFTGVLVGFAAQNTIGNAFAGMVLAFTHPFQVGDQITVMNTSGKVVEIGAMFTLLDSAERSIIIPNNILLTQAIQRHKPGPPAVGVTKTP